MSIIHREFDHHKTVRLTSFVILRVRVFCNENERETTQLNYPKYHRVGWRFMTCCSRVDKDQEQERCRKKNVVRKVIAFEIWSVQERLIFQDFSILKNQNARAYVQRFNEPFSKIHFTSLFAVFSCQPTYRITIK
jgi:hypothetical protein